jgi:hypothetical protein
MAVEHLVFSVSELVLTPQLGVKELKEGEVKMTEVKPPVVIALHWVRGQQRTPASKIQTWIEILTDRMERQNVQRFGHVGSCYSL